MNKMQQQEATFKVIRLLYLAILAGTLIFAGIIYFLSVIDSGPVIISGSQKEILLTALFISFICLTASGVTWKKAISKIGDVIDLASKLEVYQSACIKRWALIEGASLFVVVCYYLTENIRLMALLLVLVIAYLITFPSSVRMARDIGEEHTI